jgi:hypothetical protein
MMPPPKVCDFRLTSSFTLTSTLAQEELIKELTTQIARLTPMLKEGRGSTVHFLTREAADEEKRMLEERLEKSKEALQQKDAVIKDKDARIAALNEQRTSEQ